jgi:hypothetical protein
MKHITHIDLGHSFERVLAAVISLPPGNSNSSNMVSNARLKSLLRRLHEAANGRQVETSVGFIPIAPAVATFLKARPFKVASKIDFLKEAASRIITGPNHSTGQCTGKSPLPVVPPWNNSPKTELNHELESASFSKDLFLTHEQKLNG